MVSEFWSRIEGHSRWRGKPAMTAVAKYLARNLNVLLGKRLVLLRHDPAGWVGMLEAGKWSLPAL